MKKHITLDDLVVFQLAMSLGEKIWIIVDRWTDFQKNTLGKQLVRAADSVAANIAEGYGRFHFKENKNFCYYARGSLYETKTWLSKVKNRNLITSADFEELKTEVNHLAKILNLYIKSIGASKEENNK